MGEVPQERCARMTSQYFRSLETHAAHAHREHIVYDTGHDHVRTPRYNRPNKSRDKNNVTGPGFQTADCFNHTFVNRNHSRLSLLQVNLADVSRIYELSSNTKGMFSF